MKTKYNLQFLILMISCCALSQNKTTQFIDSCKIILNNRVLQYNKTHLDYELRINIDESYLRLDFENEDLESIRLKISEIKNNTELLNNNKYTFFYSFVYDLFFDECSIHKVNLRCDGDISNQLEQYKDVMKFLKKGRFISPSKAAEIAKRNGFEEIASFDLDYDPRWNGPKYYEENENKWKVTWTIKAKNDSKDSKIGYSVIKIDAKNGKVLSKYIEFPID